MTASQLAWRAAHYQPWYDRIGDGGMGWAIAAAYLAAAILCFVSSRRLAPETRQEGSLWLAAAVVLCFLGINKQLDLQIALIEGGRELALSQGWYGARRAVQLAAFLAGLGLLAAAFSWILPRLRTSGRSLRWAVTGMGVIFFYVTLRAAKFQHVLWDDPHLSPKAGWLSLFEVAGIAIVITAALTRLGYLRRKS